MFDSSGVPKTVDELLEGAGPAPDPLAPSSGELRLLRTGVGSTSSETGIRMSTTFVPSTTCNPRCRTAGIAPTFAKGLFAEAAQANIFYSADTSIRQDRKSRSSLPPLSRNVARASRHARKLSRDICRVSQAVFCKPTNPTYDKAVP